MAQTYRHIPAGLVNHPRFARLSPASMLVHLTLRTLVDHHGRVQSDAFTLARMYFPSMSEASVQEALEENEKHGWLSLYESDGIQYAWFLDTDSMHVDSWLTRDRPRSALPAPPGYVDPKDAQVNPKEPQGAPRKPTEPQGAPRKPTEPQGAPAKPDESHSRESRERELRESILANKPNQKDSPPAILIARDPAAGGLPSPAGPGLGSDFDVNEIFPDHPIPPATPDPPPADEGDGLEELWSEYEQARTMLAASGHPVKAQDGEQERLAVLVKHRGLGVVTEALRQVQIRKARAPTNRMGDGPILDLMTVLDGFSTQLVTRGHLEKGQGEVSGNAKKRHKSRNSKPGYWDDFVQPDPNYRPAA